jgi:hypothetical protein
MRGLQSPQSFSDAADHADFALTVGISSATLPAGLLEVQFTTLMRRDSA